MIVKHNHKNFSFAKLSPFSLPGNIFTSSEKFFSSLSSAVFWSCFKTPWISSFLLPVFVQKAICKCFTHIYTQTHTGLKRSLNKLLIDREIRDTLGKQSCVRVNPCWFHMSFYNIKGIHLYITITTYYSCTLSFQNKYSSI